MQLIIQKCDADDTFDLVDLMNFNGLEVFVENGPVRDDYRGLILQCDEKGVSLCSTMTPGASPTRVDFLDGKLRYRLQTSRRSAGLPKAVGLDRYPLPLRVVDATAGLGTDAFILAALGCDVVMLESSPIMAALLQSGLARGLEAGDDVLRSILHRLTLVRTNAHDYLEELGRQSARPDVIYLDPMFPARQKSAKVKKDMALLQQFLPVNDDVDVLLEKALCVAAKRVVLKRPGKAGKQVIPKPDFMVPGKACHFQVFLTKK